MGFSSDIMDDFVAKEIKNIYSTYDGWKITPRKLDSGYDTLVVLERRNGGHRQCTNMLVTFRKAVPAELLAELHKSEKSSDGTVTRYGFALMVPANANTASVPAGTTIHTMRSFAYDGNALVWLKKPVRKTAEPEKVKITA
jgi:hypothetical protein